jgi:hypothetical protein
MFKEAVIKPADKNLRKIKNNSIKELVSTKQ